MRAVAATAADFRSLCRIFSPSYAKRVKPFVSFPIGFSRGDGGGRPDDADITIYVGYYYFFFFKGIFFLLLSGIRALDFLLPDTVSSGGHSELEIAVRRVSRW